MSRTHKHPSCRSMLPRTVCMTVFATIYSSLHTWPMGATRRSRLVLDARTALAVCSEWRAEIFEQRSDSCYPWVRGLSLECFSGVMNTRLWLEQQTGSRHRQSFVDARSFILILCPRRRTTVNEQSSGRRRHLSTEEAGEIFSLVVDEKNSVKRKLKAFCLVRLEIFSAVLLEMCARDVSSGVSQLASNLIDPRQSCTDENLIE